MEKFNRWILSSPHLQSSKETFKEFEEEQIASHDSLTELIKKMRDEDMQGKYFQIYLYRSITSSLYNPYEEWERQMIKNSLVTLGIVDINKSNEWQESKLKELNEMMLYANI